jgi:hypothetical protein
MNRPIFNPTNGVPIPPPISLDEDAELQVIWEQLNGALYDMIEGDPADAVTAIEDCIKRLELLGAGQ